VTVPVRLSAVGFHQQYNANTGGVSQIAAAIQHRLPGRPSLNPVYRRIAELMASPDNVPSAHAVDLATVYLERLFERAVRLGSWSPPHVTISENSEIVFEWWQNAKKITLYFGNNEPEYIKVWGTNIDSEMDSGVLSDGWNLTSIWLWLTT
jgi:hypothetical protein